MVYLLIFLVFIFFIIIISSIFFNRNENIKSEIKKSGKVGENTTNSYLKKLSTKGKILKNVFLPTVNGETTEVDTIFITRKAVFVIESKNINGIIKGKEKDDEWISLREDRKKRFRNPILQNAVHVKYLNKQLDVAIPVYSIVSFNDEAELYYINIISNHIKVVHYKELVKTINACMKECRIYLKEKEMDELYKKLRKYTNVSKKIKDRHQKYIEENYG